ncbi:apyrase [Spizellomyces punctatus DAOM BR117]|uniref:Golgi apyrase n=1 Tax=Spizellomyces punctatus (strain DAOM BR117) TaxID=645134 RepID=A0A0L0HB20_SPIPD|nr:apyrase [Spizellomyces punctatus DAOM BR117]KNC98412.1 hypothetical protein SPPG_06116 [Spizellomyces punctatus DAOM BR117]|eukprot:XP_016606452.1 hypothetical protein SPPG_06116 [Spizellomyces punctatus DAOM BR117]
MQRTGSVERSRGLLRSDSNVIVRTSSSPSRLNPDPRPDTAYSTSITSKLSTASNSPIFSPSSSPPRSLRESGRSNSLPLLETARNLAGSLPPLYAEQNEKVFLTHCWVVLRHWGLGGRRVNRLVLLALFFLLVILVIAYTGYLPPTHMGFSDQPPTTSSDPDAAVLNLETGFTPIESQDQDADLPLSDWSRYRQYGIVIDAGSSGSRVQVYSWIDPMHIRQLAEKATKHEREKMLRRLSVIEKGDENGERWQFKEDPGISSFADTPDQVGRHLKPLLDFASSVVPTRKHASTPIYLLATAGMRLISPTARTAILSHTCEYVRSHYPFATNGGCDLHFRVISGELEGIYGWITVNYLKNGFGGTSTRKRKHTFGFLDMGGASTQIAFEPTADMARKHGDDLTGLRMRFLDGTELAYSVFVTTFLGFGMNEARRRYLETLIKGNSLDERRYSLPYSRAPQGALSDGATSPVIIPDPCLPLNLLLNDTSHVPHDTKPLLLKGTGAFSTCLEAQIPLLNKSLPCPDIPCLFNGVHAPISDALHFLGVSEYWYTSSQVYGLGGAYNHSIFYRTTETFCSQPWEDIERMHAEGAFPQVSDLDRLRLQCFKSAWIMNVLHEGLGVPRDRVRVPGDEDEDGKGVDVEGEGASNFESVDQIGNFGVSWTLGAVLLHVAATVPRSPQDTLGTGKFGMGLVLGAVVVGVLSVIYIRVRRKRRRGGYGALGTNTGQEPDIRMWGVDRLAEEGGIDIILEDVAGESVGEPLEPWQDNARLPP